MFYRSLLLTLLFLLVGLVHAQESNDLSTKVDEFFTTYISEDRPGAAVVVVKDGQVVHMNAYGVADFENQVPLSTSSVFDIASVSKQFVGYAIAILEQEGKLSLQVLTRWQVVTSAAKRIWVNCTTQIH